MSPLALYLQFAHGYAVPELEEMAPIEQPGVLATDQLMFRLDQILNRLHVISKAPQHVPG